MITTLFIENFIIKINDFLLILLLINLAFIGILGLSRLIILKSGTRTSKYNSLTKFPLVSIHLPICNEPPEIVIETIKNVLQLNYPNFELIVISNNTEDSSIWKPVEAFCKRNQHVKFWNYKNVYGYKAGALNIALQYTSKTAEYIFILDADYKLRRNALKTAVWKIENEHVDLVQFPQSYWNTSQGTYGLVSNYNHYFDCYMTRNSFRQTCLPTGTLSIIKKSVFTKGFIWPTDSITEDANLGVEMLSRKLKISFSNERIGSGVMPTTIIDYFKQYQRWLFGNFQTLFKMFKTNGIALKEKFKLATLLTAWLNLLSFTFVTGLIFLPVLAILKVNIIPLASVFCINILVHLAIQFIMLFKLSKKNYKKALQGIFIHISTIDIGSFYWLSYFINAKKPFVRTNKFINESKQLPGLYFAIPILFFLNTIILFGLNYMFLAPLFLAFGLVFYYSKKQLILEIDCSKFNFKYAIQS